MFSIRLWQKEQMNAVVFIEIDKKVKMNNSAIESGLL